jgi:outer membrane protein OmpU
MNKLKKIGLTALAGSLVATSVFAGEMSVSGSAAITFAGQDKKQSGNGWTMSDEITFAGSGEMDNGWDVSVSMQLDNNAQDVAGNNMDNRSIKIDMGEVGTVSFVGHGGDSAMSAVDDKMPHADGNETWDTIGATDGIGSVAKLTSLSGATANNMMSYTNTAMDGVSFTASMTPSDATVGETTTSFAVAYSGVEGLTLGYAIDENGAVGATQADYKTMYATYAISGFTVGYQKSDESSDTAASNDEFVAYGVSYAVSDDMTVSYNESEIDPAGVALDQESSSFAVSYTMGSMKFVGAMVTMDNVGGSNLAVNDTQGYEFGVSFAF